MSGLDIFAWIVLIVLAASTIAVIAIAGALPGMIAHSRGHPWAQAVTVAGWVLLFFGFVPWRFRRSTPVMSRPGRRSS